MARKEVETKVITAADYTVHAKGVCVLQCVADCCSMLQCFAVLQHQVVETKVITAADYTVHAKVCVCCRVLQGVAVCCSVMKYCCSSVLHGVAVYCSVV